MNQPDTWHRACPNAATCPSIHYCDPTQYSDHTRGPGYVIVGAIEHTMHAEAHGGHVGDGETVVWVPAEVIDELVQQRTEDIRAERDSLQQQIDDSIRRQAATVANRAKQIADRAAYLSQFSDVPFVWDEELGTYRQEKPQQDDPKEPTP